MDGELEYTYFVERRGFFAVDAMVNDDDCVDAALSNFCSQSFDVWNSDGDFSTGTDSAGRSFLKSGSGGTIPLSVLASILCVGRVFCWALVAEECIPKDLIRLKTFGFPKTTLQEINWFFRTMSD